MIVTLMPTTSKKMKRVPPLMMVPCQATMSWSQNSLKRALVSHFSILLKIKNTLSGGKRNKEVVYNAPPSIKEECERERQIRHNKMADALEIDKPEFEGRWVPDEQDIIDERRVFVAHDLVTQNNFQIARLEMDASSVKRMQAGLEPLIEEDKAWVARTAR